ncbi:hypothetical protein [Aeromonas sanarellii]|uniref:hypothetical protein n=1 Tax=Aeromonas sanarellii TaxID=633415 RepID=UPI0038CF37C5
MTTQVKMKDVAANRGIASFVTYYKDDFRFLLLKYSFMKELEIFFKKIPETCELIEDTFSWVDYEDIHECNTPAVFTTNSYMIGFYLLYKGCFEEAINHFEKLGD